MTDDDKQFVEDTRVDVRLLGRYSTPTTQRLCRIIRELEAELRGAKLLAQHNHEVYQNLQAEIENAPLVYGVPADDNGVFDGVWSGEPDKDTITHRARLVRIEKLEGK